MSNKNKQSQVKKSSKTPAGVRKGGVTEMKTVSTPIAKQKMVKTGSPKISSNWYTTTVRHRELIRDVMGSVGFGVTQIPLNPGLSTSFPWLSNLAYFYESYKVDKLVFKYETTRNTTTDGAVYLAIDFDAAEGPPVDKASLMAMQSASRGPVWQETTYDAMKSNLHKFAIERYVRKAILGWDKDVKTYDLGSLLIATQGCLDASQVGELYVEYSVTFSTPNIPESTDQPGTNIPHPAIPDVPEEIFGSADAVSILGPPGTNTASGTNYAQANGNLLTFSKAGTYLVDYATAVVSTLSAIAGTVTYAIPPTVGAGTHWSFVVSALVGQLINFTFAGTPNTVSSCQITQVQSVDLESVLERVKLRNRAFIHNQRSLLKLSASNDDDFTVVRSSGILGNRNTC